MRAEYPMQKSHATLDGIALSIAMRCRHYPKVTRSMLTERVIHGAARPDRSGAAGKEGNALNHDTRNQDEPQNGVIDSYPPLPMRSSVRR